MARTRAATGVIDALKVYKGLVHFCWESRFKGMVPYRAPAHVAHEWDEMCSKQPMDRIMTECAFFFEAPAKRLRLAAERLQQYHLSKWTMAVSYESFESIDVRGSEWSSALIQCVSDRNVKGARRLLKMCVHAGLDPQGVFLESVANGPFMCGPV
jgi:hypothetical protein